MYLLGLYSNLIGAAIERNGQPKFSYGSRKNPKPGYEIHHITPKSKGGVNKPRNLVYLTPREHFTAHHILARIYGGGMRVAFWRMTTTIKYLGENRSPTSRNYQTARALVCDFMKNRVVSDETKAKLSAAMKGRVSPNKGKKLSQNQRYLLAKLRLGVPLSEEAKRKVSDAMKGRKKTPEHIAKVAEANRGRKHTPEELMKMSLSHMGQQAWNKGKPHTEAHLENLRAVHCVQVTCPYCGKSGGASAMKRWHFEHCKHRTDQAA
ncbi:hypothetical protein MLN87_07350 [Escherichia coli]|nr:hypothetical protein [Escherichia coli]MCN8204079.1 hypothetical protein [Escherichia coli]HAI3384501.1 hypothetical protein [Escherichia coli]HAL0004639.1 hypothetical protein [Escherichia coli]HAP1523981.1 hypothetical protein [Escherichia coli]